MYKSLYAQMAYVLVSGIPVVLFPNPMLSLFGFAPTTEVWIQVLGLLLIAIAPYYYNMARHGTVPVVRATVQGRVFFSLALLVLVALGKGSWPLAGLAVSELVLAGWTARELQVRVQDGQKAVSGAV